MGVIQRMNENWTPLEQEIADEWMKRDALETCQGRACYKGCSRKCRVSCCRRNTVIGATTMLIGFALMALVLLIVLAILMIAPYVKSKGDLRTTCTVTRSDYDRDNMRGCTCGRACHSQYPCLTIHVSYRKKNGEEMESVLMADEVTTGPCSTSPCDRSVYLNAASVRRYQEKYGQEGMSYPCLYDPTEGSDHVIRRRLGSDTLITHLILWPLVLAAIMVLSVVAIFLTCGCRYTCKSDPPEDIKLTAAALNQHGVYTLKNLPDEERQRVLREAAPRLMEYRSEPTPQAV